MHFFLGTLGVNEKFQSSVDSETVTKYSGTLIVLFLFGLILYVPVINFSVRLGQVFLGRTSTKKGIKCFAQGHNTMNLPVKRLKAAIF